MSEAIKLKLRGGANGASGGGNGGNGGSGIVLIRYHIA